MGPGPLFEQKWLHGSGDDESVKSLQHRRQQCQCRP